MKRILVGLLLSFAATCSFAQMRNVEGTLFASAAVTTTQNSQDMANDTYSGVHVVIDVTVFGAGTLTPKIQGKDPTSGKYYDILTGAAINATGTTVLKIFPGMAVSANVSASESLPRTWRVVLTKSDASSWTYSVGYSAEF